MTGPVKNAAHFKVGHDPRRRMNGRFLAPKTIHEDLRREVLSADTAEVAKRMKEAALNGDTTAGVAFALLAIHTLNKEEGQ